MTDSLLPFDIEAHDGSARSGRLQTPHGVVRTPAFMAVASYGAVRGVTMAELEAIGAQIVLANTYHLHERPGEDDVAGLGGLHGFTGWAGPWLTDSGGFQVTSLSDRAKIDEDGVTFSSPLDGKRRTLTPENVVAIQQRLGSDIAMVLDECVPVEPGERPRAEAAMQRSIRWAERAVAVPRGASPGQDGALQPGLFGIVQGGVHEDLRRQSAQATGALPFDGFAHGGLGLGESSELRLAAIDAAHAALPAGRPRYLMGLGRPEDLVEAIAHGVDLFDCVVPTRHARHGVLFSWEGEIAIKASRFRTDDAPPVPGCDCPTCTRHSRGYLRHLFKIGDTLAGRLASVHNLRFYFALLEEARRAIAEGRFQALRERILAVAGLRLR